MTAPDHSRVTCPFCGETLSLGGSGERLWIEHERDTHYVLLAYSTDIDTDRCTGYFMAFSGVDSSYDTEVARCLRDCLRPAHHTFDTIDEALRFLRALVLL